MKIMSLTPWLLLFPALSVLPGAFSQQVFTDPGSRTQAIPKWHIEKVAVKRVRATSTMQLTAPDLRATSWILNAPCAPDLEEQTVTSELGVQYYAGQAEKVQEGSDLKRPVLRMEIKNEGNLFTSALTASTTYEATLFARRLVPGPPSTPPKPLSDEERKWYTGSTTTCDTNSPVFREFLKTNKIARNGDDEITFARKVQHFLRMSGKYQVITGQDRRASAICQAGVSDCGGFANLYVAILRAYDIPARTLVGRIITKEHTTTDFENNHVRSEFYAQGVGWIPVETARFGGNDPDTNYFGVDSGDLLVFHVGTDLVLTTLHDKKEEFPWLQTLCFSAAGRGTFNGKQTHERWVVETLPPPTESIQAPRANH